MDDDLKLPEENQPVEEAPSRSRRHFLGNWSKIVLGVMFLGAGAAASAHGETEEIVEEVTDGDGLPGHDIGDDDDRKRPPGERNWRRAWRRWRRA